MVLRLGSLTVLMMTVGHWSDMLQVLIAFLGEAVCLLSSQDLIAALLKVCVDPCSPFSLTVPVEGADLNTTKGEGDHRHGSKHGV